MLVDGHGGSGLVESMMTSGASVTRTYNISDYFHQIHAVFLQCRQSVYSSPMLQWFPSKVGDHLGDAAWYSVIIVVVNKASDLSLDLLQLDSVFV